MMSRRPLACLASLLCFVGTVSLTAPSTAKAEPESFEVPRASQLAQILDQSAMYKAGYVAVVATAGDPHSATVRGKGLDEARKDEIKRVADGIGLNIGFEETPYTWDELVELESEAKAHPNLPDGSKIVLVESVAEDTTEPVFTVSPPVSETSTTRSVQTSKNRLRGSRFEGRSSKIKVRLSKGGITPLNASRITGVSPWAAGTLMRFTNSNGKLDFCSTGFTLNVSGVNYVSTANHCASTTTIYSTADKKYLVARLLGHRDADTDSMLLQGTGSARMFTGSSTSGTSLGVVGSQTVAVGDPICTGGASSGQHCNIYVTAANSVALVGEQRTGEIAAAGGDSGGPAYIRTATDSARAVGMIDAVLEATSCETYITPELGHPVACSKKVVNVSIRAIAQAHGARLLTVSGPVQP